MSAEPARAEAITSVLRGTGWRDSNNGYIYHEFTEPVDPTDPTEERETVSDTLSDNIQLSDWKEYDQRVAIRFGCQQCKAPAGEPCLRLHPTQHGPKGSVAKVPHAIRVWDYRDAMGLHQGKRPKVGTSRKGGASENRGLSRKLLKYALDRPADVIVADRVADDIGVATRSVQSSLVYLCSSGYLEREHNGIYRLKKEHWPSDYTPPVAEPAVEVTERAMIDTLLAIDAPAGAAITANAVESRSAITEATGTSSPTTTASLTVNATPQRIEEEVDAILELLFPDGVKTTHFGRIGAWRDLTIEMVGKVREG